MSKKEDDQLAKELKTLMRRVALIQGARAGKVELRTITVNRKVMTWTVKAKQRTFTRRIAPTGWKP